MSKDSLGDRMKGYESVPRLSLVRRMPVMLRLDGKAFHTFTKRLPRPYHKPFHKAMWAAAKYLCENIQGCQIAYVQSDEITLLLTDYATLDTQAWFDYQVQKMVSVAAAMCTAAFIRGLTENNAMAIDPAVHMTYDEVMDRVEDASKAHIAAFDCRAWNLPKEEVCNAFIWRQQDATRNAIQMLGQSKFSHKQMHGLSNYQVQKKLFQEHQINFNDLPVPQKRGVCIVKETYRAEIPNTNPVLREHAEYVERTRWVVDENIPVFTHDRGYIERYVYPTP